jgi:fibronectin type 3 domain-containing protein
MKNGLGMSADEMHEVFAEWNKGELDSYLIEITRDILAKRTRRPAARGQDPRHRRPERHRQVDGHQLAGPRHPHHADGRSGLFPLRLRAQGRTRQGRAQVQRPAPALAEIAGDREEEKAFIEDIRQALYASKIVSYAQGYMLMRAAAKEYKWNLNYGGIALMWRGGCIIRSRFLGKIKEAFDKNPKLIQPAARRLLPRRSRRPEGLAQRRGHGGQEGHPGAGVQHRAGVLRRYRSAVLPANLLQAQRDYFGAHTYERVDKPRGEFFHTNWTGRGGEANFSSALIISNLIANNDVNDCAGYIGRALSVGASCEIIRNVITNNAGGGLSGAPQVVRENLIGWNKGSATSWGGIYTGGDVLIENNVIVGNTGVGIMISVAFGDRGPFIINNTIAANQASPTVSGLYCDGFDKDVLLANNIIVGYASQRALYFWDWSFDTNYPTTRSNILYSPSGYPFGGMGPNPVGTNGNISVDPQFLDPIFQDFRLRSTSPAIDQGDNSLVVTNDFDQILRPIDGNTDGISIVDLGAYEWIPRPPPAPRNLAGLSVGLQTLLSWRASPEATSYHLKRTLSGGSNYTTIQTLTGTNFTDVAVVSNAVYSYVVAASNLFGLSADSAEISVKAGNTSPTAIADTATTPEDVSVEITVATNDTDANTDALSVAMVLQVTNGIAIVTNSTNLFYTPALNFNGTNFLNYVVTDGRSAYATGQVSVVVTPVNDPPVALTSLLNIPGDSPGVTVTLAGSDVDGDSLTFKILTLPTKGILDTNTLIYRPAHGFAGLDPFNYQAFDGQTNSTPRILTLRTLAQTDTNSDKIPDAWAALHDISNADADDDLDGMSNLREYLANTNPKDAASTLRLFKAEVSTNHQPVLSWSSVGGTRYRVQTANANAPGSDGTFADVVQPLSAEIDSAPKGMASTLSFTDTNTLPLSDTRLYRIKIVTQ